MRPVPVVVPAPEAVDAAAKKVESVVESVAEEAVDEKKVAVARLSQRLLEAPHKNVKLLRQLHDLATRDPSAVVQRLALLAGVCGPALGLALLAGAAHADATSVGAAPAGVQLGGKHNWLCVFETEAEVAGLAPDFQRLLDIDRSVLATAPGDDRDFVSRFFAPLVGIDEDPVTGSAHCTLAPYWAARLVKTVLTARQVSARGGEMGCEFKGARVVLRGRAAFYLEGKIWL